MTLSILIAIFTASVALETAGQIHKTKSRISRNALHVVGAFALGGGIWAMHFIGMLAFQICGNSGYDVSLTFLSMIPSLFASWVAIKLLGSDELSTRKLLTGAVIIGLGIGTMHYSGMAAMEISSNLYYDPLLFALSIIVAVVLSILGIWVRFGLKRFFPGLKRTHAVIAGGTVLGLATSTMHYVGMSAALFVTNSDDCTYLGVSQSTFLAVAIAAVTFLIAIITLGINISLKQRNLSSHLKDERSRLLAILNTAVDGIILINDKGTILEFNPACEEMFGYLRENVVGKNIRILMAENYSRDHDQYLQNYAETGIKKIIGAGREVDGVRSNSTTFPMELSVGEAISDDGRMYIGILRDISERKKMETKLHEALGKAENASKVKTEFLANMSHEIRTPMNAIIGYVEILLSEGLRPEQKKQLSVVHSSAKSLLRLLNDVLDTAKLEQGKLELENIPFNLVELLTEIKSLFHVSAKNKELEWDVEYDDTMPVCYLGDIMRLRQILINLVGNAIKFTESGSVLLKVHDVAGKVRFDVVDTGIGIPQDKIEEIFLPFSQSDASMSRRYGGTGLGTTIAKQLVEMMGGEIGAKNNLDAGAHFYFSVPLEMTDCATVTNENISLFRRNLFSPLNILLVEDQKINADILRINLEAGRHTIKHVENGQQAIEQVQVENYDLILMDVQMPVMDGLEAAKRIREWEAANNKNPVPIIALTAGAFDEDKRAARRVGMDGYATKPVDMRLLYNEMSRILDKKFILDTEENHDNFFSGISELKLIDIDKGMKRWKHGEKYYKNLLLFEKEHKLDYAKLRGAIDAGDVDGAIRIAHSLKGLTANLEIRRLPKTLQRLESALMGGDNNADLMSEFFGQFGSVINEINILHDQISLLSVSVEEQAQSDLKVGEAIYTVIDKLIAKLSQGQDDDTLTKKLGSLVGVKKHPLLYKEFVYAVNAFEFDEAITILEKIKNSENRNIGHGKADG